MFIKLRKDIRRFVKKDPATDSALEAVFFHSGFHAILVYRLANALWYLKLPKLLEMLMRFISKTLTFSSKVATGVEIHPGAQIDAGFFIDHGVGVVIGETTVIGKNVCVYQGVTLGGTSLKEGKRHPTLGNNIVVGAGAKVLGNIDIGNYVQIGANSVVLKDIPSDCTVVGIPGRIVKMNGHHAEDIENLEHGNTPDPEAEAIKALNEKINCLEARLKQVIQNTGCTVTAKEAEPDEAEKAGLECFLGDNI